MNNIYFLKVEYVEDDQAGLRIKVKIPTIDLEDDPLDKNWPWAFPLLPKHLHINPKVGECVLVFLEDPKAPKGNRFFIGPVISQQYLLDFDPYNFSSRSMFQGSIAKPLVNPDRDPENEGTLLDREDIVIQGRQNTDIVQKKNEIRLRCGFKKDPAARHITDRLHYNRKNPAYIQMKYKKMKDAKGNDFSSLINIVADRINILSHDSPTYFKLTDRENMISEDELKNIFNTAHPLPYGDTLTEFLRGLVRIFTTHTHPFPMDPPVCVESDRKLLETNLDEMLSKSIRIN